MTQDMIIFTDLDGSLLNHEDYSFREALPALARIRRSAIPLIFVTSKTRGEVEILQQEMCIREPFIVENGGGIIFFAGPFPGPEPGRPGDEPVVLQDVPDLLYPRDPDRHRKISCAVPAERTPL